MISNLPWLEERHLNYPIYDLNLPFKSYIAKTRELIAQNRLDLHQHAEKIIEANAPFEFLPIRPILATKSNKKYKYGVLLTHGLFDSPISVRDVALHLQANGILARGLLLPGHGLYPGCLANINYQEWLQAVRYGIHALEQDVEQIYLLGFSMGSILSIYHALQSSNIAGVIIISPSFALHWSSNLLLKLYHSLGWVSNQKRWIYIDQEVDYTRYVSIAAHTIDQFHQLCAATNELHATWHRLYCPTLMICSDKDEIVSCQAALNYFQEQLMDAQSRFILYSNRPKHYSDYRISTRPAAYPELGIKNFSHVCLPVSPQNRHYGQQGDYIYASRPYQNQTYGAVNRIEANVYRWLKKHRLVKQAFAELTYNPDFDFMVQQITQFILQE